MVESYIGEIKIFTGGRVPRGWAACNGQDVLISQNELLFSVIGTTYGGDGQTNYKLPNLNGRFPLGAGAGVGLSERTLGQSGGAEHVTLNATEIPAHSHPLMALTSSGTATSPAGRMPAVPRSGRTATRSYAASDAAGSTTLHPTAVAMAGAGLPHDNMSPYLAVTFAICMEGVYPSAG